MKAGCNTQSRGPRSQPVPLLVADGYRLIQRGDILTREPIMKVVTTQWKTEHADGTPLKCGYIRIEGGGQIDRCAGCENEVRS